MMLKRTASVDIHVQVVHILYSRHCQFGNERRDATMYAMVTRWTFKTGSAEEALDINKHEVMPAVEARPGYVRSIVVQTGADSFLSIACWETEGDAKRAMAELAPLVIRQLGHLVRDVERVPGTVVYEGWGKASASE